MKRILTIFLLTIFMIVTGFCVTSTNNQAAAQETPASTGDGLTITWYDATRSTMEETQWAMATRDKSKVISTEKFTRDLSFDMNNWKNPWTWAEITGFIQMPNPDDPWDGRRPPHSEKLPIGIGSDSQARVVLEMNGNLVLDAWETPVPSYYDKHTQIGSIGTIVYATYWVPSKEGQYQYIRLCIGKNNNIDTSRFILNDGIEHIDYFVYFPVIMFLMSGDEYRLRDFPPESFYTFISAPELKPYITFDDEKNTVNINLYGLDVTGYEYGIKPDDSSFTGFTSSTGIFGNQNGTLVIREKSNPSSSLELGPVTFKDMIPPTIPGELRAGDVLRQGNEVQYIFPEKSEIRNVLLGPKREVALRWEPSTDNEGLTGYNIYRFASGADQSTKEPIWGEKEHLIGTTKDTFYIDQGLEFGATYTYYVEARDETGNTSRNSVSIGTEKSGLSDLTITGEGQILTPAPAFVYYQTDYTLDVGNSTNSINLTPVKIDSRARVAVNGAPATGDGSIGPLKLDPGMNTINIDVIPRQGLQWFIKPETTRYTLTVNRNNLENLPVLTLPENATLNEGDIDRAAGRIDNLNKLVWTGTADYGDGSGEKQVPVNADGVFVLEHQYLDNGQYKINVKFRYQDLGLVSGALDINVQNVAPALTGLKDEYTVQDGVPLSIEGTIIDPGQDSWNVSGDYGSEWGPTRAVVKPDKTFVFQDVFYDWKPEYDMEQKVVDDDGGMSIKYIKIKVVNVAPSVQANGAAMAQRGTSFTGSGSFVDPGLDKWQATVDYGDGSGEQPLTLKNDKTFDLNHVYLESGIFTVTIRVDDEDGGAGSASFQVKVKDYLFALKAGNDVSLKEGEKLVRDIQVNGRVDKVKSITVDYGDGTGEVPAALSNQKPVADQKGVLSNQGVNAKNPTDGIIPLQHVYADNGAYTVKIKLVDKDGDSYEDSFQVNVVNVEPMVKMESINYMYPGSTFTCRGSITDPGADTWMVEIDYKDGSAHEKVNVNPDKTFSFSHAYALSGNYKIEAVVQDDDGGIGWGSQAATVMSPSSGGETNPSDASLHTFTGLPNLVQDDGIHIDSGFIWDCLNYKSTGAYMLRLVTAGAAPGAVLTYTIDGGAVQNLVQNTATAINLDVGHTLKIQVTAYDGVTTREYIFRHL